MLGPNPQIAGPRPWTSGFFNPCPLRVIAEEAFGQVRAKIDRIFGQVRTKTAMSIGQVH
jgi:hypothetical protein